MPTGVHLLCKSGSVARKGGVDREREMGRARPPLISLAQTHVVNGSASLPVLKVIR